MHNCKRTRDALIDLSVGELNEAQARAVRSELNSCEACRAEQMAIAGTLRVSGQALSTDQGSEEFWLSYNHRLKNRLKEMPIVEASPGAGNFWNGLRAFATSTVRVPLPAALAALALVCVLSFAAFSRGQVTMPATPVTRVEVQTVHVPVVQEKIVTQVIYKDRKRSKTFAVDYANLDNATATAKRVSDPGTKLNLVGFKPADQVKMTIIKGNDQDEK